MKLCIFSALTVLLATGCVLDQDLGKNDQGATGIGGAAGSGTGGVSGSGTGGVSGSGTGGASGSGTGGVGGGGTGGSSGSGGTSGSGGAAGGGTGGSGGGGTGYDTVGVTYKPSAVHVVGNDVLWSTTGDDTSPGTAIGLLLREPKDNTWVSGTGAPFPDGTQVGYIHGSGRSFTVDGSSVFAWYTQIDLGWKGAGVTKLTLPSGPEEDFVDLKGPGIASYVIGGDEMVATDASYLYYPCEQFFFDKGICRVHKDGSGDVELVADTSPSLIRSMVVHGGYVYWAEPHQLLRIAIGATLKTPELVDALPANPTSLQENGGDLLVLGYEDDQSASLQRFAGAQTPSQTLWSGKGTTGSLVVSSATAYFANQTDGVIRSVPVSGGASKVVVDLSGSKFSLGDFDVDDQNVFFLALGTGNLADLVQRAPK